MSNVEERATSGDEITGLGSKVLSSIVTGFFLILLLATVFLVALSLPTGVYTVFFTHLSNSTAGTLVRPFFWIGPVAVILPILTTNGTAFVTVVVIYAIMLMIAALQGRNLFSAITSGLREGFSEFLSNRALLAIVAIGFLVFTAGMIDELVSAAGFPVGSPYGGDDLLTFVGLTLAPLREEIGFRVVIVGILAVVASLPRPGTSLGQSAKLSLKILWRPSVAYESAYDKTLTMAIIWVAGALSAGTFGACHVACGGGGWDIGKLPEATYGGFVLAYLYIKYGFHIAVLAHWGIDYFTSVFAFYGEGVAGIAWTSSPGYFLQQIVTNDLFGVFGLACTLIVGYLGLKKLLRAQEQNELPPIPA